MRLQEGGHALLGGQAPVSAEYVTGFLYGDVVLSRAIGLPGGGLGPWGGRNRTGPLPLPGGGLFQRPDGFEGLTFSDQGDAAVVDHHFGGQGA